MPSEPNLEEDSPKSEKKPKKRGRRKKEPEKKRLLNVVKGRDFTVPKTIEEKNPRWKKDRKEPRWYVYAGINADEEYNDYVNEAKKEVLDEEFDFYSLKLPYDLSEEFIKGLEKNGKYDVIWLNKPFLQELDEHERMAFLCALSRLMKKNGKMTAIFETDREIDAEEVQKMLKQYGFEEIRLEHRKEEDSDGILEKPWVLDAIGYSGADNYSEFGRYIALARGEEPEEPEPEPKPKTKKKAYAKKKAEEPEEKLEKELTRRLNRLERDSKPYERRKVSSRIIHVGTKCIYNNDSLEDINEMDAEEIDVPLIKKRKKMVTPEEGKRGGAINPNGTDNFSVIRIYTQAKEKGSAFAAQEFLGLNSSALIEEYNCEEKTFQSQYQLVMEKILEELEGKRVLDLGSGPKPAVAQALKDSGTEAEYVGIECVPEYIKHAEKNFESPDFTFKEVLMPYEMCTEDKFDVVTATACMDYLKRPEKAATICAVNQLLNKGGKFIITIPTSSTYNPDDLRELAELKQLLESIDYKVDYKFEKLKFNYTRENGFGGTTYSHSWLIVADKTEEQDMSKEFEYYRTMSLLNARKFKEAMKEIEKNGYDLEDMMGNLEKMRTIDVINRPEIEENGRDEQLKDPETRDEIVWKVTRGPGYEDYRDLMYDLYDIAVEEGSLTYDQVFDMAKERGLETGCMVALKRDGALSFRRELVDEWRAKDKDALKSWFQGDDFDDIEVIKQGKGHPSTLHMVYVRLCRALHYEEQENGVYANVRKVKVGDYINPEKKLEIKRSGDYE
ncbi:MAG: class I SAM-dependent methyltransferase [Candidatus Aenigmatarchaeota archaeon]